MRQEFKGTWVPGVTSFGSERNDSTYFVTEYTDVLCLRRDVTVRVAGAFYRNSQYVVTLSEADVARGDGKCALVVSLIQESDRPDNESNIACSFTALEVA